jgi:hypothetical protein
MARVFFFFFYFFVELNLCVSFLFPKDVGFGVAENKVKGIAIENAKKVVNFSVFFFQSTLENSSSSFVVNRKQCLMLENELCGCLETTWATAFTTNHI